MLIKIPMVIIYARLAGGKMSTPCLNYQSMYELIIAHLFDYDLEHSQHSQYLEEMATYTVKIRMLPHNPLKTSITEVEVCHQDSRHGIIKHHYSETITPAVMIFQSICKILYAESREKYYIDNLHN